MTIGLIAPDRDTRALLDALKARAPALDVRTWPDLGNLTGIELAVVWNQPPGLLGKLPELRAVISLGAGVEHLVNDPALPSHVPIGRIAGPRLASDMAAWLVGQVVSHWRGFEQYRNQQAARQWQPVTPRSVPRIGLLGMGVMGRRTAAACKVLDLPVVGFSRSAAGPEGVSMYCGTHGLDDLAGQVDYLICLLPLTARTRGILNARLFAAMQPGSVLINVGRGEHLNEDDLLAALDNGRPALALLDVFTHEPLPPDHPFWSHPAIRISPHCASLTDAGEAAGLILEALARVRAGKPPIGNVDRDLGY